METFHMSLKQLQISGSEVYCQDGSLFDRAAYSRFKYGHTPPAQEYGTGLARLIEADLLEMNGSHPTIIVSAPYKFIPTASHGIALAMRRALAPRFIEHSIEPPVIVPFHKARAGSGSYAKSDQAYRQRSLATIGLSIDECLVRNANVIVVDDIRITGAAEGKTAAFMESLNPHKIWYLHAARLSEQDAKAHPGIEDELNQTVQKSLKTIVRDVREGEFMLNSRTLGFIMNATDQDAYEAFLQEAPSHLLEQIHEATLCSGVKFVTRFPHSLPLLTEELQLRGLLCQPMNA